MSNYVALLRGMNLGKRRPKMEQLRALFEELDFANVASFIASGNIFFESKIKSDEKLAQMIESHLEKELGYSVDTFVRTRDEIDSAISAPVFTKEDRANPDCTIHVGFFRETIPAATANGLRACRTEVDEFDVRGREIYWLCRIKTNESKVWTSPAMKSLKLPTATMRNMTSLKKMLAAWPV